MSIRKVYLEKETKEIEQIENRYNFIPKTEDVFSMNKLCLDKTLSIAKLKNKKANTEKLEFLLKKYREYAVQNIDYK